MLIIPQALLLHFSGQLNLFQAICNFLSVLSTNTIWHGTSNPKVNRKPQSWFGSKFKFFYSLVIQQCAVFLKKRNYTVDKLVSFFKYSHEAALTLSSNSGVSRDSQQKHGCCGGQGCSSTSCPRDR